MARDLPPLNALRVFEAAGRQLSFTRAAAELHVTQAAVSHQIKSLEEQLGLPLFKRLNRALLLTEEGQTYLKAVTRALDDLRAATAKLHRRDDTGVLTVSTLPSFATRWLVPRLGRFQRRHPEIALRLAPSTQLSDFTRDDVDVAIRYGRGDYPGLKVWRLMTEDVFPVCSPELAAGDPPLRRPEDLRHHYLLHDFGCVEWRAWLMAAGIDGVDPEGGTTYEDSSMLIQAALAGQGVALARSVLVEDELAAGRLIRPFEVSVPSDYAYYLVCPGYTADRPRIVAFREWLFAERDRGLSNRGLESGLRSARGGSG